MNRSTVAPPPAARTGAAGAGRWLTAVSALSLAAALGLRLWAASSLIVVRAWDDVVYRNASGAYSQRLSLAGVLTAIVLPNAHHDRGDSWTTGYYLWLTLGLKLFGGWGPERAWQLLNVFLLLIQLLCVYALSRWAWRDRSLALALTAAYVLTPVVFGINRWVLSENHVLAATWTTCAVTTWVLTRAESECDGSSPRRFALASSLAAGIAIGAFSTVREYALPFLVVVATATALALLLERRPLASIVFSLAVTPYFVCALIAAAQPLEAMRAKLTEERFAHAIPAWFVHAAREAWGPFATLALFIGLLAVLTWSVVALARWVRGARPPVTKTRWGLVLLWLTHGGLLAVTVVALVVNANRVMRHAVLMMVFAFLFVLFGLRLIAPGERAKRRVRFALLFGLLLSWAVQVNHLFLRFDGGRSYAVHPTNMEYYNHPLRLRELTGGDDRHIVK